MQAGRTGKALVRGCSSRSRGSGLARHLPALASPRGGRICVDPCLLHRGQAVMCKLGRSDIQLQLIKGHFVVKSTGVLKDPNRSKGASISGAGDESGEGTATAAVA